MGREKHICDTMCTQLPCTVASQPTLSLRLSSNFPPVLQVLQPGVCPRSLACPPIRVPQAGCKQHRLLVVLSHLALLITQDEGACLSGFILPRSRGAHVLFLCMCSSFIPCFPSCVAAVLHSMPLHDQPCVDLPHTQQAAS